MKVGETVFVDTAGVKYIRSGNSVLIELPVTPKAGKAIRHVGTIRDGVLYVERSKRNQWHSKKKCWHMSYYVLKLSAAFGFRSVHLFGVDGSGNTRSGHIPIHLWADKTRTCRFSQSGFEIQVAVYPSDLRADFDRPKRPQQPQTEGRLFS